MNNNSFFVSLLEALFMIAVPIGICVLSLELFKKQTWEIEIDEKKKETESQ